ncbi:MAG: hypothetical protein MZW92_17365 [Comamonadaceae bacterium]|nr:hypothetical protein [Comamonadaceae bacterium]
MSAPHRHRRRLGPTRRAARPSSAGSTPSRARHAPRPRTRWRRRRPTPASAATCASRPAARRQPDRDGRAAAAGGRAALRARRRG